MTNVLQSEQIFINVSKGQVAKLSDLEEAFKTTDATQVALEILKKGQVQLGEKERSAALESMFKDIATLISDKSVDPNSKRPYPVTMIEKAMSDAHYSVHTGKSAKQQCAEVLKLLQTVMPIEAAKLRINCCLPSRDAKRIKASIIALTEEVTDESYTGDEYEMVSLFSKKDLFNRAWQVSPVEYSGSR